MYQLANISSDSRRRPIFSTATSVVSNDDSTFTCSHCHSQTHHKTPIHGIQLFFKVHNTQRFLWGLNITFLLLLSIYFTQNMMVEYFQNRTATHITVIQNDTMQLPTIYACPKNADTLNYDALFNDVLIRTGISEYNMTRDILLYFIAGSGFQNTNLNLWEGERVLQAGINFRRWKGNRSNSEMFNFVFSQNGLTCKDVFVKCLYGQRPLNCCEIFSPSYVLMRGRCMRLSRFQQLGATGGDKLVLYFATPESRLVDNNVTRQFVIYIGDDYPEIAMYPRLYITYGYIGKLRLKARQVFMKHKLGTCNFNLDDRGRYTCFVNRWLQQYLIEPYGCTLPYYSKVRVAQGVPICDPQVVVTHYDALLNAGVIGCRCLLNCERWDYFFRYSTLSDRRKVCDFSVEIYYPDVFYEIYSEIQITSWLGFISQVGGQIVLFLGTSIISLIFIITWFGQSAVRSFKKWRSRRKTTVITVERQN